MKRFLLFGGELYYPSGGMDDYNGSFDTLEEAKNYIKFLNECNDEFLQGESIEWASIYDTDTKNTIYRWKSNIYD